MDALPLLLDRPDLATFVWAVLNYILPIVLYCVLSALAFCQIAWHPLSRQRTFAWSAAILALPLLGAVLCLGAGPGSTRRDVPLMVAVVGLALVAAGYVLTWTVLI